MGLTHMSWHLVIIIAILSLTKEEHQIYAMPDPKITQPRSFPSSFNLSLHYQLQEAAFLVSHSVTEILHFKKI